MNAEKRFATREQSVRSDQELFDLEEERDDEQESGKTAPGKRSRLETKRSRSRSRGTMVPGKRSRTRRLVEDMEEMAGTRTTTGPRATGTESGRAPTIWRKASGQPGAIEANAREPGAGIVKASALQELLAASKGTPLMPDVARRMSLALDHDVSHVRVHHDAAAAEAARAVGARAFSVGTDVFFAPGAYAPGTAEGDRLLAHELTHVKQYDRGALSATSAGDQVQISSPSDAAEIEAARVADRVAGAMHSSEAGPAGTIPDEFGGALGRAASSASSATMAMAAGAGRAVSATSALGAGAAVYRDGTDTAGGDDLGLAGEEEAQPLTAAEVEALLQSEFGISGSTLLSYIVPDLEGMLEEDIKALDKTQLISGGRSAWRSAVGDDGAYLSALAGDIGDSAAGSQITQVNAEANWDPAEDSGAIRQQFFSSVADAVNGEAYLESSSIYTPGSGPFADAAQGFLQKGRPLELAAGSDLLFRRGAELFDFFRQNLSASYRASLLQELESEYIKEEFRGVVDSDGIQLFWYWQYLLQSGRMDFTSNIDSGGSYQGLGTTTFWQALDPTPAGELSAAGFGNLVDLSAAGYESDPADNGVADINIDPAQVQDSLSMIRKPTALDSMVSGGEAAAPGQTEWAVEGEGMPPLLAPTVAQSLVPPEWVCVINGNMPIAWYNLKGMMENIGNEAGKRLFADENNPHIIRLGMFESEAEVTVPADQTGDYNAPNPGLQHPGAQVESVNVSLDEDGALQGGSATVNVQGGGAITSEGAQQEISADSAESGTIATEVEGASTSLGELIDGISVDARLIEGGVEAEVTISAGTIAGIELTGGTVTVRYVDGQITGEGEIGVSAAGGKLTGTLGVVWDGGGWTLSGSGTVSDLLPDLEPFDVEIVYAGNQFTIRANGIEYSRELSAISITTRMDNLVWDQATNAFGGNVQLDIDLGMFGRATGTAVIDNNILSQATVNYTSPEITYPQDGESLFTGTVNGAFTYENNQLSATFDGTASLALGSVVGQAASNLALAVDATLNPDGTYAGTIATTETLQIGDHFAINGLTLNLGADGAVTGDFAVQVVDVPFLSEASINGRVDENGLQLDSQLTVSSGSVGGVDITGGTINVAYAAGAITGSGTIDLSAAGGKLSGTVNAGYDGRAWTFNGTAQVSDLIPNLDPFDVQVNYADSALTIDADGVEYSKDFGAISVHGTADDLHWDQPSAAFNGTFNLDVDLGLFGAATATATVQNSQFQTGEVTYSQPELRYPVEGETPFLTGDVQGTFTYTQEGISGDISGSAQVAMGGAGSEGSTLSLTVSATLNADGTYSGTIATTESVTIGQYFVIDGLSLTLNPDGSLGGDFSVEAVNVPFLENASITGSVDENGLQLGGELAVTSGSVGGVGITGGSISMAYAGGALTGSGSISISALEDKVSGTVTAGYDGTAWTISGTAQVSDLIPNLDPFDVAVSYENEQLTIEAQNVSYTQEVGALTFTGTIHDLTWEQATESFSGSVSMDMDLGLFGAATASATIADNALSEWDIQYTSPELTYPAGSDSPLFTGTLTAELGYANDQLSGTFSGTANLAMPELAGQEISNLGLAVNATLNPDGTYSGTIETTETLQIGDYFAIPGMSATLQPDGSLSGTFSVEVVNLPYLDNASISCAIDETGVSVTEANVQASFGDESSRAWGNVGLTYADGEGFIIEGGINIRLSEGMIANGDIRYTTATNEVTATLGMDEVSLLDMAGEERTLLEFDKDIIIFTLYQIVGLYLDVGFDLAFNYNLNLSMQPTVTLAGLSLDDFSFDEASAEVGFLGSLAARLMATPNLGVGVFVLHPKLLKGGGGVGIPIVAEAVLTPEGTFSLNYLPEGGIDGDATLGLALSFEVKGSVVPYAEFSVLDGAIEHDWQGDSLADFEILPKRELFNYVIDFNALGEEPAAPELPTTLQEPTASAASTTWEQDAGTATQSPVAANREAAGSSQAAEEAGSDASGLDLGGLVGGLVGGGGLGALREILDAAGQVWDSIQDQLDALGNFFANWYSEASASVVDVLNTIRTEGFVGLIKNFLREQLGDEVYDIFEPLLDAAGDIESSLIDLLSRPIDGFDFGAMIDIISDLLGLAWNSIPSLVRAIGTVVNRARDAGERLVGHLVSQGQVGVRRHGYYFMWYNFLAADEYKIHVGDVNMQFREDGILIDPQNAIAGSLWNALQGLDSVQPTNTAVHERSGERYNDYWV